MAEYTLKAKLIADATNLEKNFAKAQASLQSISSKFSGVGSAISGVGAKITSAITKPALAATSALAGITLVKGFNRLTGIDDARAKLKALRFDAVEVEDIMKSALDSVKGTAYGLDEAATTAANAVAAGIKPGQALTKYLTMTSDAAAIAGTSMSEMGSIINKVQTGQIAYTEDLEQLADRGLPIYQWLGEEAGVAASEIKQLASDGQISSEMLFNAIEKNVGGAAKIMGESSFSAALANINASISRIGANFLDAGGTGGGFFSQLKPLMAEFNEDLGSIEEKAAELGVKFGEAFSKIINKVMEVKREFQSLSPEAQKAKLTALGLSSAFLVGLGPGLTVAGKGLEQFSTAANLVSKALGGEKAPLSAFTGGFSALGKEMPTLKSNFSDLSDSFGFLKADMLSGFKDFAPGLSGAFGEMSTQVSAGKKTIVSSFLGIGGQIKTAGGSIVSSVSNVGSKIGDALPESLKMVGANISENILSPIKKLGGHINGALSGMLPSISSGLSGLGQSIASFAPMFLSGFASLFGFAAIAGLIVAGFGLLQEQLGTQIEEIVANLTSGETLEKVRTVGQDIVNALLGTQEGQSQSPGLIEKGMQLITTLINGITAALPTLLTVGISILSALVTGIGQQLPVLIPAAMNMIITLATTLLSAENISSIINAGIQLIFGLAQGLLNAIPDLIAAIPTIIRELLTGILSNLPKLLTTGIQLLIMMGTGLIRAIPDLLAMLPQIFSAIFDAFGNVDWLQLGKDIIGGIINGIKDMAGALWESVKETANGVIGWFEGIFKINSPSRVMRDDIGVMLPRGIGVGVAKGAKYAISSVRNLGTQVLGAAASITSGLSAPIAMDLEPAVQSANAMTNLEKATAQPVAAAMDWTASQEATEAAWTEISTNLDTALTGINADSTAQMTTLETTVETALNTMETDTKAFSSRLLSQLRTLWQIVVSEGKNSWTMLRTGIQAILGTFYGVISSGMSPSMNYIAGLPSRFYSYGQSMISEMARGVRNTTSDITGAVSDLVETVKNKFIEGFEIHSPSHFTYYIGTMLGKGLMNSLRDSHLSGFVDNMIAKMKNSFENGRLNLQAVMSFMGDKAPDLLKELGITLGGSTGIIGNNGMIWPTDSTDITSWFGNRPYPGAGGSTNHGGLDIGAPTGTNVYAALGGTVVSSGWLGGYGNAIQINHGNGLSTLYGHMSQLLAAAGQTVAPGQVIGLVGSTGNSTGPHLHFETLLNGMKMDPASFFGFSVGSSYIPSDMLAMVHKGEAILTAQEAEKIRRLMRPARNPYRNSGGPVLSKLFNAPRRDNGGFGTIFNSIMSAASSRSSGQDPSYGWDPTSDSWPKNRPVNINVTSVLDGRKVGYGTARYSKEKNDFDSKRKDRIGGIT